MNTSYNPSTDSLYIHLADHASIDSVELTDGLVVDYDLDGVAVGIDMQRVSQTAGVKDVKCTYREKNPQTGIPTSATRKMARLSKSYYLISASWVNGSGNW